MRSQLAYAFMFLGLGAIFYILADLLNRMGERGGPTQEYLAIAAGLLVILGLVLDRRGAR